MKTMRAKAFHPLSRVGSIGGGEGRGEGEEFGAAEKLRYSRAAPSPNPLPRASSGERARATRALFFLAALAWLLGGCASQDTREDDHLARAELLALLQTLNADLLSHDSATLTLERWCGDHRLAEPARIVARRVRDGDNPVPDDVRARLAVGADEPIGYRHVQLVCGAHVLSEADNWYVPARLTPEMNHVLDTTDEPFGKVVRALGFQRRTLAAELLWSPLPAGWETAADSGARATARANAPAAANPRLRVPHAVLRHEAVLSTPAQIPFSAVIETYTSALFAFGDWQRYVER